MCEIARYKYLVLKIADIDKYLSDEKQLKLDAIVTCIRVGRLNDGKCDQEYVCVAADWPMYEQVWGLVEAFVDGKPNAIEQLQTRVALISQERNGYMEAADRACDERDEFKAKVAELEEENAWLKAESRDACLGLSDYYSMKLAAEHLNNKLLRKALEAVIKVHGYESGIPVEALSTQASTEALDKYVAEKVKDVQL